ncbi:MAG: hypothetical protein U1E56_13715 [Bauldia sp.]
MSAALLTRVGEALFGARWQSALAAELGVADRTMRRWAAGDTAIPDGIWQELRTLVWDRARKLTELGGQLTIAAEQVRPGDPVIIDKDGTVRRAPGVPPPRPLKRRGA